MQFLANLLNTLTSPIAHLVAFETVKTTSLFETWRDEASTNVILMGRLKVVLA